MVTCEKTEIFVMGTIVKSISRAFAYKFCDIWPVEVQAQAEISDRRNQVSHVGTFDGRFLVKVFRHPKSVHS